MLVLSRVVGFGTRPQTAFLFFIGYGAVAVILLVALSMAGYRPGAGVALWDAPVVATLVAPLSLIATVVNAGVASEKGGLAGWFVASALVISTLCFIAFVIGRMGHRALAAAAAD